MFHRRLPCYFVSLKCRSADCLKVMMKVSTFGYNLKATGASLGHWQILVGDVFAYLLEEFFATQCFENTSSVKNKSDVAGNDKNQWMKTSIYR